MQLYLSSYHLGNNATRFAELVKGQKKLGLIGNALDFSDDLPRVERSLQKEEVDLVKLGLQTERIDLRTFFNNRNALSQKIELLDGLWVKGGNTFILRRAMAESGLDEILQGLVKFHSRQEFVYAGYSAGVCILSPTLHGIDLMDDPSFIPEGYSSQTIWDGLGLLPYYIVPHYRSGHPESESAEKTVEYYSNNKLPFLTLRDSEDVFETI